MSFQQGLLGLQQKRLVDDLDFLSKFGIVRSFCSPQCLQPSDDLESDFTFGLNHKPVALSFNSEVLISFDKLSRLVDNKWRGGSILGSPHEKNREVGP